MKLTEREVAILRVLTGDTDEVKRGLYAGRVAVLAGFKRSGRMDAGATRTLDSMEGKGFVRGLYDMLFDVPAELRPTNPTRRWKITDGGRTALGEWAFGEPH